MLAVFFRFPQMVITWETWVTWVFTYKYFIIIHFTLISYKYVFCELLHRYIISTFLRTIKT